MCSNMPTGCDLPNTRARSYLLCTNLLGTNLLGTNVFTYLRGTYLLGSRDEQLFGTNATNRARPTDSDDPNADCTFGPCRL